jgi:guanylate kinase
MDSMTAPHLSTDARSGLEAGRFVVISGPSGAGKTSVCRELKRDPRVVFSVSSTTRAQRPGERDGVDYHFLSDAEFEARVARGEFLEHAVYNGRRYGTERAQLARVAGSDRILVLEIEVQGTRQLREKGVQGIYVFVVPPSMEELRRRLVARQTDRPDEIEQRLAIAEQEMAAKSLYDHIVVNRDLEQAVADVRRLISL